MQVEVKVKNSYKVFIDEGLNLNFKGKVAILTSPKVAELHLESLLEKIQCEELSVIGAKDGEEYKNLSTIEEILSRVCNIKLDGKSLSISFGGGATSDMGGFAASIYQRDTEFINIPTTPLACVDAAVGGKTGVNNHSGKNLISTFYQPKAVYCESTFLRTLGQRELSAGLAEFIKMAVIFEADLLDFIEKIDAQEFLQAKCADAISVKIIAKSTELKSRIVAEDEKEGGVRMLLNYGHTFAHIIENGAHYKSYLHGEVVAIGINMANHLNLELGLLSQKECERIEQTLQRFALPTHYKTQNIHEFYNAFFSDKKSTNHKIRFILVAPLGRGAMKENIPETTLLKSLEHFV